METQNKSPEVRFEGFTEGWGEIKFKKLFFGISNNSLSRDKLNYNIGKAKNIHYGDILIKFRDVVDVQKEIIPYVTEDEFVEKYRRSNLMDGDIIFADAAEDETVGKCIEIVNIQNDIVLAGLHTIAVRPQIDFASKYLGYYLNSKSYHNQLLKLMQGTKVLSISKNSIRDTVVYHPKQQQEQLLISKFFNIVDDLITNHQTQLTKLKNLKKAMLTKMFPQNGASVPEIRFKGFDGEWEDFYLDKLCEFSKGKGLSKNDVSNSGLYECILYGHLYTTYGMVTDKVHFFTNKSLDNKVESVYGDVLIPSSDTTPTGLAQSICIERDNVVLGGDINILRPKKGLLGSFLSFNINANRVKLLPLIKGSTVRHLYNEDLKTVKISVPKNINEQYKISQYFKNTDVLIENHREQLNKLNNIKKACLNKLFVS